MTEQDVEPPMNKVKAKLGTLAIKAARLDPEAVPVARGWAMAVSFMVGVVIALVGVGILYAGLRVYVETQGGVVSLPVLLAGLGTFGWGANHASGQVVKGGAAHSLSALAAPFRAIRNALTSGKSEPTEGE